MIRWLLLGPYLLAEPWLRHPSWIVRRTAEIAALAVATIWLALPNAGTADSAASKRSDELADRLWSSPRMREFLNGPAIRKPLVGRICRILVLRLSVHAKTREGADANGRNFALRIDGPIDQRALRNLLIWQNHVLPSYVRAEDGFLVDIALVLTSRSEGEARLDDLFSVVLMLDRIRSFSVFWDEEVAAAAASVVMPQDDLSRRHAQTSDLGNLPDDITREVELRGTRGGVKLLPHGRRYANDFLKVALPGRFVVAVGLRERKDGTVAPEELGLWLSFIDKFHTRNPQVAFVVLNCLSPSQWREWPAYLRFPRHQGLNLAGYDLPRSDRRWLCWRSGHIRACCPFRRSSGCLCSARGR